MIYDNIKYFNIMYSLNVLIYVYNHASGGPATVNK